MDGKSTAHTLTISLHLYSKLPFNNFKHSNKCADMNNIVIIKAAVQDTATIKNLGRQTFVETFGAANDETELATYLKESFSDEKVMAELLDTDSLFFIAWNNEEPVGYLKLNSGPAQTEVQDNSAIEIERIYVKSAYHGKKVGQLLYEKALEIAREQQKSYIWLGVWEENPRAIRFYEKNGFVAFDKHIFRIGVDEQTDIMMKKLLLPG